MSAPTIDCFCSNGHHVHQYGNMTADFEGEKIPTKCLECGSSDIQSQWEWGDPSYEQRVSSEPMCYEEKMVIRQQPLYIRVGENYLPYTGIDLFTKVLTPVYEVSKLFLKGGQQ